MGMRIDNRFKYFKDINESLKRKYDTTEDFPYSEMAEAIDNIPSGSDFDMTVTDNQVKMVIEVDDYDLSFWTRFCIIDDGTVTVDWGDGTTDTYTGSSTALDYAPQRKHNYQNAGKYLVILTVSNGVLMIGSTNGFSTLSEGDLGGVDINRGNSLRRMYNYKIKELAFGNNIIVNNLQSIPYLKLYNDVDFLFGDTGTDSINVKNGRTNILSFMFAISMAYKIKIPSSVTQIESCAFDRCLVRIIDFTDFQLNENNELPFVLGEAAFRNTNSAILLFATQEIAEVAKTTTNLSQFASQIKYVGEV